MPLWAIILIAVLVFGSIFLFVPIMQGIVLCKKNKVFGIFLLTISLPIIGTFIGCMIIYKTQNPEFKFWKSLGNKFKIKRKNKKVKFKKIKLKLLIDKNSYCQLKKYCSDNNINMSQLGQKSLDNFIEKLNKIKK
ncbi:hypothetical protein SIXOD_v1c09540 [Spiroplasma ixodetis Y32]|nr:hypothetical protein SIXOD_v1c09540 [Spiroplasma ixodetis Y32]